MGWAGVLGQPIRAYVLATGRQAVMLRAMSLAAVLNVVGALILVPRWGAWGAVWSNGLTQIAALLLMTLLSSASLPFRMNWEEMARLWAAAALMAACVAPLPLVVSPLAALLIGPPFGAGVYLVLLRLLRGLRPEDRSRLLAIGDRLPKVVRSVFGRAVRLACP
jgi:O-antigen/teichoic acid export membrane protein